jgi:hypothetical protein
MPPYDPSIFLQLFASMNNPRVKYGETSFPKFCRFIKYTNRASGHLMKIALDEGSNGTCSWKIGSESFELDSRFTVLNYIGEGGIIALFMKKLSSCCSHARVSRPFPAYGMVCSAYDKNSHEHYAIKKCKNIFQSKVVAKRTVRELKLLSMMAHPNVRVIKQLFSV